MPDEVERFWRGWLPTAAVLAIALFVAPLAVPFPLLDPDEGLHASIAQEMIERGEWITPTFLGQPFLDKPIFYFWVQIVSLRLLGHCEAAVRLPGLLFGLLGAITTGLLAWRLFLEKGDITDFPDRETPSLPAPARKSGMSPFSIIAGVLYATMILPTALAQAASHDVALIPWVNLALLALWESGRAGSRRRAMAFTVAAGLLLGLAVLTKGLVGVAVVGVAYGGYLLVSRQVNLAACLRAAAVLLIAAAPAAAWYLAVEQRHPGFLRYYFLERHLLAFAGSGQPHGDQPWWYYLPILLGGGLPWIGYLPILVQDALARFSTRLSSLLNQAAGDAKAALPNPNTLLWCWLIGWTLLLTLAGSKLATYLWPAFPAVAILASVAWTRLGPQDVLLTLRVRLGPQPDLTRNVRSTRVTDSPVLSDAARRSFARTFVWSSWSGPIVLPAAMLAVQWVYAMRFSGLAWLVVGAVAAAAPLPLIPWHRGRLQPAPGGGCAVDGRAVSGRHGDGVAAGSRDPFGPRFGRTLQPDRPSAVAAARGRRAHRLAGVLSRPAAPRRPRRLTA